MEGDRHHYHDLIEELHKILSSKTLSLEQLEDLRKETEGLLGRVGFHCTKALMEQDN